MSTAEQPLDFLWVLTDAQREILKAAHIEPWMLHPNSNPDHDVPHVSMVHRLGDRVAFIAMEKVDHVLYREIFLERDEQKVTRNLLHQLRCEGFAGCHHGNAYEVFDSHHRRLALWVARSHVKYVGMLKSELRLTEDLT